jgi:hypothetical protein
MNTALARSISTPRRLALALALAATGLAGCGGGGEDLVEDPPYVNWSNSVNGTLIRDGNNEGYSVRVDNRTLVNLDANTQLTGLTVDTSANIRDSGVIVGSVAIGTSTTGSAIAVLRCLSGRSMDVRLSSSGWSYVCL